MFKVDFNSQNQPLEVNFSQEHSLKPTFSSRQNNQHLQSNFSQPQELNTNSAQQTFYTEIMSIVNNIRQNYNSVYYDTKENWDAQLNLKSEKKAIYIYSNYTYIEGENNEQIPVPAIKIGDGTSYLIDMPFVNNDIMLQMAEHINNNLIHITNEERIFWNNKVSCFLDDVDDETLIFSKTLFKLED